MRKWGVGEAIRDISIGAVWLFLMWQGTNAVDNNQGGLLMLYVLMAATGASAFVAWLWKKRS